MSDWFIVPPIENAVLVFAAVEQSDYEDPDAPRLRPTTSDDDLQALLQTLLADGHLTPYLFLDPPEDEDLLDAWAARMDDRVAVAAMPFGTNAQRIGAAFRRVFARNDTKRAVWLNAADGAPNTDALRRIHDGLDALQRSTAVVGLSTGGRVDLVGFAAPPESSIFAELDWDTPQAIEQITAAFRQRNIAHEVLPLRKSV